MQIVISFLLYNLWSIVLVVVSIHNLWN